MPDTATTRPRPTALQIGGRIIGLVLFAIPFIIEIPGLDEPGERMLSIFLLAIAFWVTQAIPLFATATLVILLQVLLISSSAILPVTDEAAPAAEYFAALANPVIILFLGGFLIADGAAKYGLDKNLAAVFVKPFAGSARKLILGMMLITTLLGAFMSNTATTAAMFAIVIPMLGIMPNAKSKTALALSIPLAANIGGVITPVSTPPNAIAVGILAANGFRVSFVDWMMFSVPFMLVLMAVVYLLLIRMVPKGEPVEFDAQADFDRSPNAIIFYVVAGATILMWMTEPVHGVAANVVGFIPVVLLIALEVMDGDDIGALDWPVLWLVAGGIALGDGIGRTGLDRWLIGWFDWSTMPRVAAIAGLVFMAILLGNFISNSAAANLLIPLAVGFAATIGTSVYMLVAILALASSLGMTLPISTPPNAIAFSTGVVPLKQMALIGVVVGVVGGVLLAFVMPWYWTLLGRV